MWVLFIFLVLCLGYLQATSTPSGRAILKRSQGWESYAHLAKNGIELLLHGTLLTVIFAILVYGVATFSYLVIWLINIKISPYQLVYEFFSLDLFRGIKIYELLIILFSFYYHVGQLKKEKTNENWREPFKNQDAILNVILEAAESQTPLRITLKSRKVYIGIVESEQFERADLDNLVIIPYLSGHRDKDTLEMRIDHNYYSVYAKNNILKDNKFSKLATFKIVIRLCEVESLSLFDIDYYSDFHEK